ncbi:MAG: hypothetical protein ABI766_14635 [Gemmatimonadales bacterium]
MLRHSGFWTEREYSNTPLGSMWATLSFRHEVLVPMTPYGGIDRRLLLWRDQGPDFTERELMMLRLIRRMWPSCMRVAIESCAASRT